MHLKATLLTLAISALPLLSVNAQEVMDITQEKYSPAGRDVTDIADLLDNERYSDALTLCDSLIVLNQQDDALHYFRGVCLRATGDSLGAEEEFKRAIELDSSNGTYYEQLFSLYDGQNTKSDKERADSLASVMAEKFPKKYRTPQFLTRMADKEYYISKNDSAAIALYDEALSMDEEYLPAIVSKASVCESTGRTAEAFVTVRGLLALSYLPAKYKADFLTEFLQGLDGATLRIYLKEIDSTMDDLAKENPADSAALVTAGGWFYSTGRKEKGREYFYEFRDANPDNVSAELLCISLVSQEGSKEEVIKECDDALKRFTGTNERVQLLSIKADCLYETGRKTKAFQIYEKILRLDPDNLLVLNNYAYFLSLERKHLRKAEKMSRKTVEAEGENVSYLDTYGYILYLLKRPKEAKTYLKKAIIFGGKEDASVLLHYSLVLKELGEDSLSQYYRSLYEAKVK